MTIISPHYMDSRAKLLAAERANDHEAIKIALEDLLYHTKVRIAWDKEKAQHQPIDMVKLSQELAKERTKLWL